MALEGPETTKKTARKEPAMKCSEERQLITELRERLKKAQDGAWRREQIIKKLQKKIATLTACLEQYGYYPDPVE